MDMEGKQRRKKCEEKDKAVHFSARCSELIARLVKVMKDLHGMYSVQGDTVRNVLKNDVGFFRPNL